MNILPIGDTEYSVIRKGQDNFVLVWESATEVKKVNPRTKQLSGKPVRWEKYYGALHKTLCGFVKYYSSNYPKGSTIDDIEKRVVYARGIVKGVLDELSEADKEILEEWKVVRVAPN